MWRRLGFAVGEFLCNNTYDALIGLGVAILSFLAFARWGILLGLALALVARLFGEIFIYLSEKIPPDIVVIQTAFLETESHFKDGDHFLSHFLPLSVINKEHYPLEEFSAFLVYALYGGKTSLSTIMSGAQPAYLGWKGTQNCKVDIDAHGGEQTLYVYKTTLKQDKNGNKIFAYNSFNFCDTNRTVVLVSPGDYVIEIKIEFRGVLNEKPVRARDFIGYVKLTMRADATGTLSIHEGKPSREEVENANKTRTING